MSRFSGSQVSVNVYYLLRLQASLPLGRLGKHSIVSECVLMEDGGG